MGDQVGRGAVNVADGSLFDEELRDLDGLEVAARARLGSSIHDYIAGGAGDEWTLARNRAAWNSLAFLPRMLCGVAHRSLETVVLGTRVGSPILIAPMAFHGLCHLDAEAATARAAAAEETILVASTLSNLSIDAITAAMGRDRRCWFQLYVHRDRGLTRALVERAAAAGCTALCLTVDTPLAGTRDRDRRNRFSLPDHLALGNLPPAHSALHRVAMEDSSLAGYIAGQFDPSVTWTDVDWLRSIAPLPVLVKGILRGDDARLAVEHGAAGVIASNHGGRQLDGTLAPIEVLDSIVEAVEGRAEVLLDGGVRRGTDVLKALALGARAVLVGRPVLWALAVGGSHGVRQMLSRMRAELDVAMALAGCRTPADISRDLVCPASTETVRAAPPTPPQPRGHR